MASTVCVACGMPLTKPDDFGNKNTHSKTCIHCTRPDGQVKSCDEVFAGGLVFFQNAFGVKEDLAKRLTRKNMQLQHYGQTIWKNCACLQGSMASDDEWSAMLSKLTTMKT